MAGIIVNIIEGGSQTEHRIEMPADIPMNRLIPGLVDALGLAITDSGGRPLNYRLLTDDGVELRDTDSLNSQGIESNATLTIIPRMEAGHVCSGFHNKE